MNSIVEQCIASINDIKNTDFETEMDICESVIESYSKTLHLLEYYRDADAASLGILECKPLRVLITEAEQPQSVTPAPANNQQQQQTATGNTQASNTSANATEEKKDEKKDDEKLWQADFRKTKDDGKKEHIIISILAFIPRLLWAIITFIGRWVKSLFKGKDKAKAGEQKISNAVTEAAKNGSVSVDEATEAMNKFIIEQQAELARRMGESKVSVNSMNIAPAKASQGTQDANGAFVMMIYPPVNMAEAYEELKLIHTTGIVATLEMINEFKNGKVDKINELDKYIESFNKGITSIKEKTKIAKTLVSMQNSNANKSPVVSYNSANTGDYALTLQSIAALSDQIVKLYDVMSKDVEKINAAINELKNGSNANQLVNIQQSGMTKLNNYVKILKEYITLYQQYLGMGLETVDVSYKTITDIENAINNNPNWITRFFNRSNSNGNTNAAPTPTQTAPTPAANTQPAAPTPTQATPTPVTNTNTQPATPTPTQTAPTPAANQASKPSLKERASSAFNNAKTFFNAKKSKLDPKILRQLPQIYQGTYEKALQNGYTKSEAEWKSERSVKYNAILSKQTLAGTVNQRQPAEQTEQTDTSVNANESAVEPVLSFEEIMQEFELLDAGESEIMSDEATAY